MENNKVLLINAVPAAAQLRAVPNFNPRQFLRLETNKETGETQVRMELRYKKLWFRLAFPNGSMHLIPLHITDQAAVYEAMIYLDRKDERPISSASATRTKAGVPDGDFVKAAQNAALEDALDDAGFGIQLCAVERAAVESDPSSNSAPTSAESTSLETDAPQAQSSETAAGQTAQPGTAAASPIAAEQPPAGSTAPAGSVSHVPAGLADGMTTQPIPTQKTETPPAENVEHNFAPGSGNASGGISAALGLLRSLDGQNAPDTPQPKGPDAISEKLPGGTSQVETGAGTVEPDEPHADEAPAVQYPEDMSVEDILARMTQEEAGKVVIANGVNRGWTMEQVAEKRASSLKFYAYLDDDCSNIVKAAALILLGAPTQEKAI